MTNASTERFAAEWLSLMDKKQAAQLLQITTRTLENHMRAGLLPYLKIGRTVRFDRADLLSHLNRTCRVVRASRP